MAGEGDLDDGGAGGVVDGAPVVQVLNVVPGFDLINLIINEICLITYLSFCLSLGPTRGIMGRGPLPSSMWWSPTAEAAAKARSTACLSMA